MFPTSYFPYGAPTYSYARPDSDYFQALAEEEAARRQYADALRAQEEARNRAARARLARQAYESAHNAYLSDEDEDMYGGYGTPAYDYGYPSRRRSAYGYPSNLDRQRLAALELERERERERLRMLEERERRRRMMELEEERRRRRMLEEEERRMQLQREAEERERRRLEQELLRRQQQSRESSPISPFEEFFGIRPPRMAQSKSQESPLSRRARTMSPRARPTPTPSPAAPSPVERTASRSPPHERIPIRTPTSPVGKPAPAAQRESSPKLQAREAPTEQQIEAATKIQARWRRHRALRIISEQAAKFAELQKAFTLPSTLDYATPGSDIHSHEHISIPVPADLSSLLEGEELEGVQAPKLAYTPTNAPVHMYEEELSRILTKLDGVESGGDQTVRKQRRETVRSVEKEAGRIERLKVALWKAWQKQREQAATVDVPISDAAEESREESSQPVEKMEVDVSQASTIEETSTDSDVNPAERLSEDSTTPADEPSLPQPESTDKQMATEPSESTPEPTTASTSAPDNAMSVDPTPAPDPVPSSESLSQEPEELPTIEITPEPEDLEHRESSIPRLETDQAMDGDADTESDVPPTTPDLASQTELPSSFEGTEKAQEPKTPVDSVPKTFTKERLDMLRPLFMREWEDEWDFF